MGWGFVCCEAFSGGGLGARHRHPFPRSSLGCWHKFINSHVAATSVRSHDSGGDPSFDYLPTAASANNQRTEESACHVVRKPLIRIFNGEREFLFFTERNIHEYEWRKGEEVAELLEDLLVLDEEDDSNDAEREATPKTKAQEVF